MTQEQYRVVYVEPGKPAREMMLGKDLKDLQRAVGGLIELIYAHDDRTVIVGNDEAKLIGGLGACGRPLCCATFLSDFVQVSIKMAKEQGLFLNSSKISGTCGRLMCCLRYEQETYEYEIARTPAVDSTVKTPDGVGTVTETHPLSGMIKVKVGSNDDQVIKIYHRDNVKILHSAKKTDKE